MSETEVDIGIDEILSRIPHRYPFLLLDRAEDFRPNERLTGIKCVTFNEPFFQGHFPGHPVMPGVLIIEALAQTGAILMSKSLDIDVAASEELGAEINGSGDIRYRGAPAKLRSEVNGSGDVEAVH